MRYQLIAALLLCQSAFGAYTFKRTITVNSAQVPSTQTNYPMGFFGTYAYLKGTGSGGNVTNSSGFDIAFFSDAGLTTQLPCEQVTYSATTGAVEYWIGMSSISNGTVIYLAYGNSSISTAQCTNTTTSVWDSHFHLVLHFPDGTSLTANDSSSYGNNGTVNLATATSGAFDGAASCNAANTHYVSTAYTMPTANFTYSQWINTNDTVAGTGNVWNVPFGAADYTGGTYGTALIFNASTSPASVYVVFRQGSNTGVGDIQYNYGGSWAGTFHYAVTMSSTAGGTLFLNGASVATNATYKAITTGGANAWVCRDQNQNQNGFNGFVDETRVSDIVRSADWITTEFNNGTASTFYTIGAAVGGGSNSFSIVM